jgi:hypothetical protein
VTCEVEVHGVKVGVKHSAPIYMTNLLQEMQQEEACDHSKVYAVQ